MIRRERHAPLAHPKVGASWEGFALQVVVERLGARPEERFFWATHAGAELDSWSSAAARAPWRFAGPGLISNY